MIPQGPHWREWILFILLIDPYWRPFIDINVRRPSNRGLFRSIPWLLMPWLLASPGHQQPWYWLCEIGKSWSFAWKDYNYLCHVCVQEGYGLEIHVFILFKKCLSNKGSRRFSRPSNHKIMREDVTHEKEYLNGWCRFHVTWYRRQKSHCAPMEELFDNWTIPNLLSKSTKTYWIKVIKFYDKWFQEKTVEIKAITRLSISDSI